MCKYFFSGYKSDLHGPDSPAVGSLVANTGKQGDAVFNGGGQQRGVRFADLVHAGNRVGAGAQLGCQGDGVTHVQVVDVPKIAVGPAVVTGDGAVAVPNAGILKVARPFRQDGAARTLVDPDVHIQAGDFQGSQVTAAIVEVRRDLCVPGGGSSSAAVGDPTEIRWGNGDPGAATDDGPLARRIAWGQIGRQGVVGI